MCCGPFENCLRLGLAFRFPFSPNVLPASCGTLALQIFSLRKINRPSLAIFFPVGFALFLKRYFALRIALCVSRFSLFPMRFKLLNPPFPRFRQSFWLSCVRASGGLVLFVKASTHRRCGSRFCQIFPLCWFTLGRRRDRGACIFYPPAFSFVSLLVFLELFASRSGPFFSFFANRCDRLTPIAVPILRNVCPFGLPSFPGHPPLSTPHDPPYDPFRLGYRL